MSEKSGVISKVSRQGGRKRKLGPVLGKSLIYLKKFYYLLVINKLLITKECNCFA